MNGLKNKTKLMKNTTLGLQPAVFDVNFLSKYGDLNEHYLNFMNSSTVNEQLTALKNILNEQTDGQVTELCIIFIVNLFLEIEQKHAVKCFLTKYIIKTKYFHDPFISHLKSVLSQLLIHKSDSSYYTDVCMKLCSCLENFPPGEAAVRSLEVDIGVFLKNGLDCCISVLRRNSSNLSPTKKNELYNTSHLIIRLINNIISKSSNSNHSKLICNATAIRSNIMYLFEDIDVPMDTKSLCGIVVLLLHDIEFGGLGDIISPPPTCYLYTLLSDDVTALCLYSAIVTSPYAKTNAIVDIAQRVLDIGERSSSSPPIILLVSRTFLSISRGLSQLEPNIGSQIVGVTVIHVWAHVEHHLESVRHHSVQTLGYLVKYCCKLHNEGNPAPLEALLNNVLSLEHNSKSYYLSMTSLVGELGATYLLKRVEELIPNALSAVNIQHVQASLTTFLETLLDKHVKESDTKSIYKLWIEDILDYAANNYLEPGALNIMEGLLVRAVTLDNKLMTLILPTLNNYNTERPATVKRTLMLLSVVRKSNLSNKPSDDTMWRGLVTYEMLKDCGIHVDDNIRLLSLTLVIESNKSTEVFSKGDLDSIIHFLWYNINSQSGNFRQIMLSQFKKFMRRLQDSHRVLNRKQTINKPKIDEYFAFVDTIRRFCLKYLRVDSSYSRKYVGLQLVLWVQEYKMEGYENKWSHEECNALHNIFEDTFENIQILALDVWKKYTHTDIQTVSHVLFPSGLPKDNDISFIYKYYEITDRRTNGYTTAGYVLRFVDHARRTLQCSTTKNKDDNSIPDVILLNRFKLITDKLKSELEVASRNILIGASKAPMYGYLHILTHLMKDLKVDVITSSKDWALILNEIILVCISVCKVAAEIVNNDSPEGYLGIDEYQQLENGDAEFISESGRERVSAQAVLGCAWRSVKEVSLLLGEMSSRLPISSEDVDLGLLDMDQIEYIGQLMMDLLTHTKHRGAFEQAYVGFTMLCNRLWRCRSPRLLSLPRQWSASVWNQIKEGNTSATRRSAGLPYIVQALVTSELQITGNTRCFHESMTTLLELASKKTSTSHEINKNNTEQVTNADCSEYTDSRVHSLNILRALYRNTALGKAVTKYVGDGFIVAIRGFDAETWAERNASTLLFSALMVRTFGVTRTKDLDHLERSNKMTGRIFFLRYPQLYEFILESLKNCGDPLKYQSVGPLLDVLARLYPSSLEGTHSNLKLSSFVPLVCRHASSSVMKIRISAARALVPLLMPAQILPQILSNFELLSNENIKRNLCHGLLLQLSRLLSHNQDDITIDATQISTLTKTVQGSMWILRQAAGVVPCYVIADEYVKVINLMFMRLPGFQWNGKFLQSEVLLEDMIFNDKKLFVKPGREICLSNAVYLTITIKTITKNNLIEFIRKTITHDSYEVKLATINTLLILQSKYSEKKTHLQKELENIKEKTELLNDVYNNNVLEDLMNTYSKVELYEIKQKILILLLLSVERTCENYNEKYKILIRKYLENINEITYTTELSPKDEFNELIASYYNSESNINYTEYILPVTIDMISYRLKSTQSYNNLDLSDILFSVLFFIKTISQDLYTHNDDVKNSIISLLDLNFYKIVHSSTSRNPKYNHLLYITLSILLNDEDPEIRNRTSSFICRMEGYMCVLPCKSYETLATRALFSNIVIKAACTVEDIFNNGVENSYSEQRIWRDLYYKN